MLPVWARDFKQVVRGCGFVMSRQLHAEALRIVQRGFSSQKLPLACAGHEEGVSQHNQKKDGKQTNQKVLEHHAGPRHVKLHGPNLLQRDEF
jgi:hypothetical protein